MKPYYDHGGVTIFHGDCREIAPKLNFDGLVLSDVPYGIDHPTDYMSRARGDLAECRDYPPVYGDDEPFDPRWLLNIGSARILWGANWFAPLLPAQGGWLVWDKERPDDLDQATCELAWSDCIKGVRRFRFLWNGMIRASHEPLEHPTQKPEALMRWCLSLRWTETLATVLDPYMGFRHDPAGGEGSGASRHRHRDRGTLLRDRGEAALSGSPVPSEVRVTLLLHRVAALYLRLRRKRMPLEDLISAWSGGRWDPRIYELPKEAPSPGELVAGVDGPRTRAKGLAGANPSGKEHDRAEPSGQRGSVEGGPPTSTAAANRGAA